MINLELYKIFVLVANEKNITRASEKLNISQPAVTKQIKNLENLLGKKLFERTNKGLILTDTGNELYQRLKEPIKKIIDIDSNIYSRNGINIGSHNHLLNKIFGKSINEFCLKYPNIKLNLSNLETNEMLNKLSNKELDVVFSKKVDDLNLKNVRYIQLGYLNDIFIINKNSEFSDKVITKEQLKNQIIYVPRTYAQTVNRLIDLMEDENLNLRNSSYTTILELTSKSKAIGVITKEYIDEGVLDNYNLSELRTELNLEPVEFGIYLNENNFKDLRELIRIIKENFNV